MSSDESELRQLRRWGPPARFKSVAYAPGKAYNRSNNDLVDAKMDVNGSVTAIGAIYTTEGGANICSSSGTGKYIQQAHPARRPQPISIMRAAMQ